MQIQHDSNGQPYIQWKHGDIGVKRVWIQVREGDKDYANTKRYLQVVRIDESRPGIGGNPTDFPIFSDKLSDEQILRSFVHMVCALTSTPLESE